MVKLARFLKAYKWQTIIGPFFKLIEAIFELIVPLVMADMIDKGIANGDTAYIWQQGGLLVLLGVVGLACSLTCQYLASVASQGVGTNLRSALFAHLQSFSHAELDAFGTPTLVTRMTNDINQLQLSVAMLIRLVVRAPFLAIGAIVMAFRIDSGLSLVFLAIVPVVALVLYIIMGKSIPFFRVIQKKLDAISLISRENLSGVRVVRAFGTEQRETARFDEACDDQAQVAIGINRLSALLSPLTTIILNLGIVAIVWFGGIRINAGVMSQGQVVALVNYMGQILLALVVVANLVVIFTKAAASATRVNEIFETKPSLVEVDSTPVPIPGAPRVEYKDVSFAYSTGGEKALRHISFSVKAGQQVGIVGGTGSGKSTLLQLLPRFYDATEGQVLVDGVDVMEYPFHALREKMGIVPQKAVLFSGTVDENLRWRKDNATEQEMDKALRIAQGKSFIDKLSGGLQSPILQGGKNFSGGQRQRLTIARALVGDPEILILDDSASALDYATDAALRQAINTEIKDTTVFIISQRISTVRHCDCILVMEEGAIVARGTHEELMATSPLYREIANTQGEVAQQ